MGLTLSVHLNSSLCTSGPMPGSSAVLLVFTLDICKQVPYVKVSVLK